MKRLLPLSFFLATFLIVSGGCGSQASSDDGEVTQRAQKAPTFTLTDIKGKKFSLQDYRGKVVFLDFWATWCPPCVMSVPEVEKIVDEYKGKPFEAISISLDQDPDAVKSFVASHHMVNRIAIAGDNDVSEHYGVEGIPAFFLIDKKGNVVRSWGGYSRALPSEWRKELDRLLKT